MERKCTSYLVTGDGGICLVIVGRTAKVHLFFKNVYKIIMVIPAIKILGQIMRICIQIR